MARQSPANLPPRVVDERKTTRSRSLLGGKVIYGGGRSVQDCTIRDISEKGAKISLARGEVIPTRVFLIDRRRPVAYEAKVTWIKAPDFGLTFLRAFPLEERVPSELGYLRAVWKLCAPISGPT